MKKSKENGKRIIRLRWQIGLILTAFYLIFTISSISIIRYSSMNTYLTAKNDMMQRDMERIKQVYFSDNDLMVWMLDFWHKHSDDMQIEITQEEEDIAYDSPIYGMTEETITDYLDSHDYKVQLAVAKSQYNSLKFIFEQELDDFNYGSLFIIGIGEENRGFVYIQENSGDEIEKHKIGDRWNYDLNAHPAARKFLSGKYNTVEFEISDDGEFNNQKYYLCAMPFEKDGSVSAVICIGYNWNTFYTELMNYLVVIALAMFAGMLVMYLLMMLIVNRIITKPLSTLQSAVKDFTENNDCNSVAEKVDRIRSKNEIGTLSRDFKNLAFEVDEYIKEIQKAEREIANVSNELLVSLALTIDAKDKYTNGHSLRVASYSKMLAQRLGFSEKDCDRIYKMGLLHDIGKIGIPNNIINKKGKLTDEEYDVIKTHTVRGYEILKEINSFPELAEAAKWHHEKFDGTGYPDKLTGAETSLEIRIISVADSYDAMTSNRSYRGYMAQDTVKKEIEKNSGTQFDPIIAKEMIGIIEADKDYQLHEFAPENIGE